MTKAARDACTEGSEVMPMAARTGEACKHEWGLQPEKYSYSLEPKCKLCGERRINALKVELKLVKDELAATKVQFSVVEKLNQELSWAPVEVVALKKREAELVEALAKEKREAGNLIINNMALKERLRRVERALKEVRVALR